MADPQADRVAKEAARFWLAVTVASQVWADRHPTLAKEAGACVYVGRGWELLVADKIRATFWNEENIAEISGSRSRHS